LSSKKPFCISATSPWKKLNNAYATSSNKIGMMTFNSVQKPLIIEFSKILLDLKIILTY
jgi:hypothetical protein